MRRIVLIALGICGIWLGGCVGEVQPIETPDTTVVASEEAAPSAQESAAGNGARAPMAAADAIGTSDQSLRIDGRPPPQPYIHPEAPPAPSDGK